MNRSLIAIRGATTSEANTVPAIENAVIELINEFTLRNSLVAEDIISITFTVTKDIDACFPASIARKYKGLDSVAFLDCQQMFVDSDINFCIRFMAIVTLPPDQKTNHTYLRGAVKLRPDRC